MLEGFSKYYDVMSPEDKKGLLRAMISSIEINELPKGKRADGRLIKTIHFTFPVTYDGESGVLFVSNTGGEVETVMVMSQQKPDDVVRVGIDIDKMNVTKAESKATYAEIQTRVKEQTGLNVTPLYIAQVKAKHGIIERENYNHAKSETTRTLKCPPDKEKAIEDALQYFKMI